MFGGFDNVDVRPDDPHTDGTCDRTTKEEVTTSKLVDEEE